MHIATINREPYLVSRAVTGHYRWLIASVVGLLSVFPRVFYLTVPFERDEGAYAYIADVIRRGGEPYVSAFDNNPPLIYYLYDLSFKLLGHSIPAPRLAAAVFAAGCCCLVWVFVHQQTKSIFAASFASLLLGISSSSPEYTGFTANTEIFTLFFLVGGAFILSDDNLTLGKFFLSGLLFGIAFMIKQPAGLIAMAAFLATSVTTVSKISKRFMFYAAGLQDTSAFMVRGITFLRSVGQ